MVGIYFEDITHIVLEIKGFIISVINAMVKMILLPNVCILIFTFICTVKLSKENLIELPSEDIERKQSKCLMQLIDQNFNVKGKFHMITFIAPTKLPDQADHIRTRIIKHINLHQEWPIEITDGNRKNFVSTKIWKNGPKPNMR